MKLLKILLKTLALQTKIITEELGGVLVATYFKRGMVRKTLGRWYSKLFEKKKIFSLKLKIKLQEPSGICFSIKLSETLEVFINTNCSIK